MKALKANNTEAINRFHQRKVHNAEVVETPQDDPPEPPVPDNGPSDCWKQPSPFSNVHFRNTTKDCSASSCS